MQRKKKNIKPTSASCARRKVTKWSNCKAPSYRDFPPSLHKSGNLANSQQVITTCIQTRAPRNNIPKFLIDFDPYNFNCSSGIIVFRHYISKSYLFCGGYDSRLRKCQDDRRRRSITQPRWDKFNKGIAQLYF